MSYKSNITYTGELFSYHILCSVHDCILLGTYYIKGEVYYLFYETMLAMSNYYNKDL